MVKLLLGDRIQMLPSAPSLAGQRGHVVDVYGRMARLDSGALVKLRDKDFELLPGDDSALRRMVAVCNLGSVELLSEELGARRKPVKRKKVRRKLKASLDSLTPEQLRELQERL